MVHRKETNVVVFHHSLTDNGNVESFRKYHVEYNGWEDIGYHFVIPATGHYEKGRDIHYIGSHAYGKNKDSIGVCLIGNFFKYEPTVEQLNECLILYHGLCRLYSKNLMIDFHRVTPNPCPGPKLDRKDFIEIMSRGRI
jgi:hypothetical protein